MTARPRRAEESKLPETVLAVRIQPRSSKNGIVILPDGALKIRLTAPPVDGAANEALIAFLSRTLQVSKSQIEIVSGHTAREKRIRIAGIVEEDARQLLNGGSK